MQQTKTPWNTNKSMFLFFRMFSCSRLVFFCGLFVFSVVFFSCFFCGLLILFLVIVFWFARTFVGYQNFNWFIESVTSLCQFWRFVCQITAVSLEKNVLHFLSCLFCSLLVPTVGNGRFANYIHRHSSDIIATVASWSPGGATQFAHGEWHHLSIWYIIITPKTKQTEKNKKKSKSH